MPSRSHRLNYCNTPSQALCFYSRMPLHCSSCSVLRMIFSKLLFNTLLWILIVLKTKPQNYVIAHRSCTISLDWFLETLFYAVFHIALLTPLMPPVSLRIQVLQATIVIVILSEMCILSFFSSSSLPLTLIHPLLLSLHNTSSWKSFDFALWVPVILLWIIIANFPYLLQSSSHPLIFYNINHTII